MKYSLEAHLEPTDGPMELLDCPVSVYEGSIDIDLPDVGVLSISVDEFRRLAAVVEHEQRSTYHRDPSDPPATLLDIVRLANRSIP